MDFVITRTARDSFPWQNVTARKNDNSSHPSAPSEYLRIMTRKGLP